MVEVMKIMVTSFKRFHAHTVILSAPDPAPGHCQPTPPLETPGHSRASLGQSLVGSLLLSPESWCAQGFVCTIQESVSLVLCKFWWLYGDLLQEGLCHTQVCLPQSPCPCSWPVLHRRHSNTVLAQSLWGLWVLVHTGIKPRPPRKLLKKMQLSLPLFYCWRYISLSRVAHCWTFKIIFCKFLLFIYFWAMQYVTLDLSSLTRDQTCAPCIGSVES